ncbi:15503_t:CDS:2 [Cetraspora pellucida]|uniref:15503_t:CDS:1 n=1 Tax=Cetraspora pellucida TaxID=1433469 RepID=A0A9N9I5L5_9GLOM|nr:15503_t:CDS:2 [Cetraspora pellucida]
MNKIKKRKENSDANIKKRISLTSVQKKELCEKKHSNPNLKDVKLAKEADILLFAENLNDSSISVFEKTELEDFVSEKTELEVEIINLIEHLLINDSLNIQEYIKIDNYMNIEEDLTVNDIVNIVNGQDESESEKEHEEIVKIGDAIIEFDNLIKYIQQNNLEITSSLIKKLCSLKKYIIYLRNESKRQAMLEEFISLTV